MRGDYIPKCRKITDTDTLYAINARKYDNAMTVTALQCKKTTIDK